MIDLGWLAWTIATIGGAVLLKTMKDNDRLKGDARLLNVTWPSEGDEEAKVEEARELCRRQGIKLTFRQAALVLRQVRAEREKAKVKEKNK